MPSGVDPSQPFLRQAGLRAGITKHELDGPRYRSLFRAVRIDAGAERTALVDALAVALVCPAAVVSHHTAARVWGAVVPQVPDVHITVPDGARVRIREVRAHESRRPPALVHFRGARITSPEQTFLDLASELDLVDLVVLGDSLIRRGRTSPGALRAAAQAYQGRRSGRARQAAGLVRDRVESPMETRLRLLFVLSGLPEPRVNVEVQVRDQYLVYRIDLAFAEHRLGFEYDGEHHLDRLQRARDQARIADLRTVGWHVEIFRSADLFRRPGATVDSLFAACRAAGMDVPARPDPSWRRHFPGYE